MDPNGPSAWAHSGPSSACLSDLSFDAACARKFFNKFLLWLRVLAKKIIQKTETKHPHRHTHSHPPPLCRTHVCFVDCFGFFIYLIKFRNTPANNLWLWNLHINPAKCCQIIELINIYLAHWPHTPQYPVLLPLWCKACTFIWQPETFNPCWLS